ncbi:hypothetical protein D3C84_981360 [compost metagenome]
MVGNHRSLALAQYLEQVAVGHRADAFVPRFIARAEMAHVETLAELAPGLVQQRLAYLVGEGFGEVEKDHLQGHVAPARQAVNPFFRQEAPQDVGDHVFLG